MDASIFILLAWTTVVGGLIYHSVAFVCKQRGGAVDYNVYKGARIPVAMAVQYLLCIVFKWSAVTDLSSWDAIMVAGFAAFLIDHGLKVTFWRVK